MGNVKVLHFFLYICIMGKVKVIGKYDNDTLVCTFNGINSLCEQTGYSRNTILRHIASGKAYNGYFYRYTGDKIVSNSKNTQNIIFDLEKQVNFKIWERRKCPVCGLEFYARKKYAKITCSDQCQHIYNSEFSDINAKRSLKLLEYNKNKDKSIKKEEILKAKQTCLRKYGVDNYNKSHEGKEKLSKILKNRDWSGRNEKNRQLLVEKYTKICKNDDLELIEFKNRFDCTVKCKKCGNIFDVHVLGYLTYKSTHGLCRVCNPIDMHNSSCSEFIEKILTENGIKYIKNDRKCIYPYEIDILIPGLNIGFEINGNYWHSELGGSKNKSYHIDKTIQCHKNGVKLIHIFEDEIVNKPSIVKSRVLNLIKCTKRTIYARKCELCQLTYDEKHVFLQNNHIDGDSVSKYNIGLKYNGELVSVATFGTRKISGKAQFELIRFASALNTNVIGGFSRILKHFKTLYGIKHISTYADMRWSGMDALNNVYTKNGFKFVGYTQPNYFYVDRKKYIVRLNRANFTKYKLVKQGYDKNLTEAQIMFDNGYDRIWDCGSMKFEM